MLTILSGIVPTGKSGKIIIGVAVIILFSIGSLRAAEIDESKMAELKTLQEQQDRIMFQYQKKKQALEDTFQQQLNDLGNKKDNELARSQLIQETKKKQEELKAAFQAELREVQKKERKLRTGREDLDTGVTLQEAQAEQLQKDLKEKQTRQELLKKAQQQDERYFKNILPSSSQPSTAQTPAPTPDSTPSPTDYQSNTNNNSWGTSSMPQSSRIRFRDPTEKTLGGN